MPILNQPTEHLIRQLAIGIGMRNEHPGHRRLPRTKDPAPQPILAQQAQRREGSKVVGYREVSDRDDTSGAARLDQEKERVRLPLTPIVCGGWRCPAEPGSRWVGLMTRLPIPASIG